MEAWHRDGRLGDGVIRGCFGNLLFQFLVAMGGEGSLFRVRRVMILLNSKMSMSCLVVYAFVKGDSQRPPVDLGQVSPTPIDLWC